MGGNSTTEVDTSRELWTGQSIVRVLCTGGGGREGEAE